MATNFEIQAEAREQTGKAAARRMRRLEDNLPGIIYGAEKPPQSLTISHKKLKKALENPAFFSHILTIDIAGSKEKAILRAIQRHPYKPKIMHIDFQRISPKQKLTMNIPLHFIGEDITPAVKIEGGVISHLVSAVEVSCLPDDLPEYIEVDISDLKLDHAIHLSDLKLPKGIELVELLHEHDLPVVSIHLPRAALAEEEAPAAEAAAEEEAAPTEEKAEGKE